MFSPIPQDFFQKSGSVTFAPLWCTNFMQKIRKILRAVFELWTKNIKNGPKMGFFSICNPHDFFQKSGSVTFAPLWCPNFMQKLEKNIERSLRYLMTDRQADRQTDKGNYYGPHQVNLGSKNCKIHDIF